LILRLGAPTPQSPHQFPNASTTALAFALPKSKPPAPSTRLLAKLTPCLAEKDCRACAAWWLILVCLLLGLGGAGVLCWLGMRSMQKLNDSQLCLILDDRFDTIDTDNARTRDIELGGFG